MRTYLEGRRLHNIEIYSPPPDPEPIAVKAFPTAYGPASNATGGRGGVVVHVTNLNDSGAGSFRAALEMTVPRIIVFDVSGVITLTSRLEITSVNNSNFTIAGQTSPIGGITVVGDRVYFRDIENVIIRHIRFKGGIDAFGQTGGNDSFSAQGDAINQIFDHVTFAFDDDESASWIDENNLIDKITIQNCLFGEGWKGSLFGTDNETGTVGTNGLSFSNNLFYNNTHRLPNISIPTNGARIETINNVGWNVLYRMTVSANKYGGMKWNNINNYFNFGTNSFNMTKTNPHINNDAVSSEIYTNGNKIVASVLVDSYGVVDLPALNADNKLTHTYFYDDVPNGHAKGQQIPLSNFVDTMHPILGPNPISLKTADEALTYLSSNAGCNARLNADGSVSTNQDTLDAESLSNVRNGIFTVRKENTEYYVPAITSVTRPGGFYGTNPHIPQAYLTARGISNTSTVHNEIGVTGYTILEEYLNQVDVQLPPIDPQIVKAFPTAEGYGKNTIGGRGGRVIFVTNLNNSGPGSLREACEATGPRNVVFKVGGRINLTSTVHIENPYITIWGQSAPGDGICLSTEYPDIYKTMGIITSEVIIQHIRFRRSTIKAGGGGDSDCLWIGIGKNIVIDHCSLAWSSDGNLDITNYRSGGGGTVESNSTRNITISNCIIGPNLGDKTKSILVARSTKITFYKNFFINSRTRNPAINNPVGDGIKFDQFVEIANNFYYDHLEATTYNANDTSEDNGMYNINYLNNKALKYTSNNGSKNPLIYPNPSLLANHRRSFIVGNDANLKFTIYAKGNITPWRYDDTVGEYEFVQFGVATHHDNDKTLPLIHRSNTPIQTPLIEDQVTLLDANDIFETLKSTVGASYPTRDAEDIRAINDVETGTVSVAADFVPTFPIYNNGTPPVDSNNDGIPDSWTTANMPSGAIYSDLSPNGYTWLERYLQSLVNEPLPPDVDPPTEVLAFPDAVGFGKYATGGRGGQVIKVTNLNNSGAGSLRQALMHETGPRTITFDVSGTIDLVNAISITNGDITIAFQTAPGDGILITGAPIFIESSNVIIRYPRIRVKPDAPDNESTGLTITAWGDSIVEDIIIDHASLSWAPDPVGKNFSARTINPVEGGDGTTSGIVRKITLQHSILSESLYAFLGFGNTFDKTIYGNLFAFNDQRNIRTNYPTDNTFDFEMINNLIYGCRNITTISYGSKFSYVNNHVKESSQQSITGPAINVTSAGQGKPSQTDAYMEGNDIPSGSVEYDNSTLGTYKKNNPWKSSGIVPILASDVENSIKSHVGASLPNRDSVDNGIITKLNNNTGQVAYAGTFPTIASVSRPAGFYGVNQYIPQSFLTAKGIANTLTVHNELAPSGYTWLEEYLN